MKTLLAAAALAVALPALGQTYYEPRPYPSDRLSRGEFDSCLDRGMVLRERKERSRAETRSFRNAISFSCFFSIASMSSKRRS